MRFLTIIALISAFAVQQVAAGGAPQLGAAVPREARLVPNAFVQTAEDRHIPLYRHVVGDVTYDLGVESEITVVYVGTLSRTFTTPENVNVGSTLALVKAVHGTVEHGSPHGDYSLVLPSGWTAVFRYGAGRTKRSLSTDDEVIYLFKKRNPTESGQQPAANRARIRKNEHFWSSIQQV